MSCVVCAGELPETAPHFANAWETARKIYPCCTAACAAKFDPDVHWLPARRPAVAEMQEEARLLRGARERIRAGDRPSLVVRDMLLAGVGVPGVRKLVIDGELDASAGDAAARKLNIIGVIRGVLGGGWRFTKRMDRQDPTLLRAATADIETWTARFGS